MGPVYVCLCIGQYFKSQMIFQTGIWHDGPFLEVKVTVHFHGHRINKLMFLLLVAMDTSCEVSYTS